MKHIVFWLVGLGLIILILGGGYLSFVLAPSLWWVLPWCVTGAGLFLFWRWTLILREVRRRKREQ